MKRIKQLPEVHRISKVQDRREHLTLIYGQTPVRLHGHTCTHMCMHIPHVHTHTHSGTPHTPYVHVHTTQIHVHKYPMHNHTTHILTHTRRAHTHAHTSNPPHACTCVCTPHIICTRENIYTYILLPFTVYTLSSDVSKLVTLHCGLMD